MFRVRGLRYLFLNLSFRCVSETEIVMILQGFLHEEGCFTAKKNIFVLFSCIISTNYRIKMQSLDK